MLQAELMDQDLSLMEQLLTLNDKIEEMKHKYMYSVSKDSLGTSSCNLSAYCDYTDSETSLASLDINDYNEDCLFGSDLDVGEMGTDDVFVERPVSIDDAFKQWVKKQMSDKDSDSDEGLSEEKQRASAGAENIKNIPKDQEKYPRCQSEGFIVSEQHGSDDFTENSELQTGETGSRILGLVTNGACASSPRKNNSGPAKAETHDNKVEMPDIKLDDTNEGNKLNPETKHLTLDFKSNISSERTNISFDSDDNLNLDDYDDTILNV